MPPQKKLTDRDTKLLEALIKTGALSSRQVREIYGGVSCYHYKRLKELEKRGYLNRTGQHIQITQQGAKAIGDISGQDDAPIRIREPWQLKQRKNIADIFLGLSKDNWSFMSSRDIKKEVGISSSAYISCFISTARKGYGYAVYLLSNDPHKHTIRNIKGELDRLIQHGISKAIIFCPNPESMKKFGAYNGRALNELLVLPFPFGLSLLNNINQIHGDIQSRFNNCTVSIRPFADYEEGNTFISVLINNDFIKKEHLKEYLNHARKREGREIIIACLQSQAAQFSVQFPGVKQCIIPDPKGVQNESAAQ